MAFRQVFGTGTDATWLLISCSMELSQKCRSRLGREHRRELETPISGIGLSNFHHEELPRIAVGRCDDQVAPGRYRPGAPTDPYVPALEHTVHRIRGLLRV